MMKATETFMAGLFCPRCGEETPHILLYAGPHVKDIRCTRCGRELARPTGELRAQFIAEIPARARALAKRGAEEIRRGPITFLRHLPAHAAHKGLELSAEIYVLWDEADHPDAHI